MAKNSVRDFDATAANNTDIQSVDIAENCAPSGINNAIRELMADIKDVSTGTVALESPQADSLTVTGDLTVDTDTLFVDASADKVVMGTTSADADASVLTIKGTDPAQIYDGQILIHGSATTGAADTGAGIGFKGHHGTGNRNLGAIQSLKENGTSGNADAYMRFVTRSNSGGLAEAMRITSTGNVGIGTNSIHDFGVNLNSLQINGVKGGSVQFSRGTNGATEQWALRTSDDEALRFESGSNYATERMRVTSTGDLLVGKSTTAIGTAGSRFISNGQIQATASNNEPYFANRLGSDGVVFDFRHESSTVGAIETSGSNLVVQAVGAVVFKVASTNIGYFDAFGMKPWLNNTYDLGASSGRWRDIYTDGAVNTSDQNKKQQIETLTTSEISAAKRISALFKKFKWNDAVAEKGDAARTHVGIIAQDVKSALEAEGLDASKYAFWCSNTWWETHTEVPAVEAVEAQDAVYDEDGNLVSEAVEAVEAQDAYTRRDVYETAEEAPEDAVEVTLQSVRYAELMAFVGAATEQRLTSIEARLTALEA